uniref:SFRICE_005910 n=1 Tax=Spodoptera frugiperda TaxID=7108 RepID=A0A2H1VBZ6_SPOFR
MRNFLAGVLDDGLTDGQLHGQETSSQVRVGGLSILRTGDEASSFRTADAQRPNVILLKEFFEYLQCRRDEAMAQGDKFWRAPTLGSTKN